VFRFAAGVIAGYVIYRVVERPFLRLSKRIPVPVISDRRDFPTR
jgi:peptidoglycan/LPS O-acetylase OafA/YrhL